MALPNPIPDNPNRWADWKNYNSPNLYARLCLDSSSNATPEVIEDHCRRILVWWQKKLPLKNQPSNPMSQLLRGGLDEAPQFLVQARTKLLDPMERAQIDAEIYGELLGKALVEFSKLLDFTLADKRLSKDSEEKLRIAGEGLGLDKVRIDEAIAGALESTGAVRVVDAPPPASAAPPAPAPAPVSAPSAAAPAASGSPADEFRRILKMSRLCLDGEEMSDDQRDAMCNLGESLGLSGGDAEDVIDEYLEAMASAPMASAPKASPGVHHRPPAAAPSPTAARAAAQAKAPAQPAAPVPKKEPVIEINTSQAALAMERAKFPNFTNRIGIEMFLIPSGRFVMGSEDAGAQPNEGPVTPVVLSCFYMARLPVTNEQYEMFDPTHAAKRAPWADGRHPVLFVSWNEAVAFCEWLGKREGKTYRLPTEAEWEFSARSQDGRIFPWGSWSSVGQYANFADMRTNFPWRDASVDDGFAETSPVGSFSRGASPFGIEDLSGNVFEWCLDSYEPYKGKEILNPRAQKARQRVYRGGSWKSRMSSLRATARAFNEPSYLANDVGFRIACECA
ncbi:MAG: formylglycine-generating enzyme family protein [Chthoniobacteraceae bacterium]